MELKRIHARWYWYRRWRDGGHVHSQYVGRDSDLAADPGIAMAVNGHGQTREIAMAADPVDDLAADPGIAMAVNGHGQAREIAMAADPVDDLAIDLGIAMAADPVDDLTTHVDDQIDFNFTGPDTITIINVAPGATNITTNGVPAGNAAPGQVDVSSTAMVDRPAIEPEEP